MIKKKDIVKLVDAKGKVIATSNVQEVNSVSVQVNNLSFHKNSLDIIGVCYNQESPIIEIDGKEIKLKEVVKRIEA